MSGIDHLVLAVRDLEEARRRYASLGFTLTPPARHPFGTGNSLVQLDGGFLELLAVVAPEDIPETKGNRFSFAAFNRDYLEKAEGLSMLVLASDNARKERTRMQAAGLTTYDPFDFSRRARLPSGEEATVGFSLAFTTHPEMPNAAFFFCQQHAPEHFWKPEFQRHANTALSIQEVGLVASRPAAIAAFLASFADVDVSQRGDDVMDVDSGRGRMTVATPDAFEKRWGFAPPDGHDGPRLCAYRLAVADPGAARARVEASGTAATFEAGRIVIAPQDLFGCGLVMAARGRA